MIFRWFESLIDVFGKSEPGMPPQGVARFYAHYLHQIWPLLLVMAVVGLLVALVEVAMFDFLGRLIDMTTTAPAADFFSVHGRELLWPWCCVRC